jgi:hypothetical protein
MAPLPVVFPIIGYIAYIKAIVKNKEELRRPQAINKGHHRGTETQREPTASLVIAGRDPAIQDSVRLRHHPGSPGQAR